MNLQNVRVGIGDDFRFVTKTFGFSNGCFIVFSPITVDSVVIPGLGFGVIFFSLNDLSKRSNEDKMG